MRNLLRSCGRCGGHHIGHDSTSFDGNYFCPKCMAIVRPAGFNPQANDAVRLIDGNQQRRWVVLARRGELADIRLLGLPESPTHEVSIHNLW